MGRPVQTNHNSSTIDRQRPDSAPDGGGALADKAFRSRPWTLGSLVWPAFLAGSIAVGCLKGYWDIFTAAIWAVGGYFSIMDVYYRWRDSRGPFVVITSEALLISRPALSVKWTEVDRYVFKSFGRSGVAFTLFLKNGLKVPRIKWGGRFKSGDNSLICRRTLLAGDQTADAFFRALLPRLEQAGASDARCDPGLAVSVDRQTGEASVSPKGYHPFYIKQMGLPPKYGKWGSFGLGTVTAAFVLAYAAQLIGRWETIAQKGLDWPDLIPLGPLFAAAVLGMILPLPVSLGDRLRPLASYMDRSAEWKKFCLGASLGLVLCAAIAALIFYLVISIHIFFNPDFFSLSGKI